MLLTKKSYSIDNVLPDTDSFFLISIIVTLNIMIHNNIVILPTLVQYCVYAYVHMFSRYLLQCTIDCDFSWIFSYMRENLKIIFMKIYYLMKF